MIKVVVVNGCATCGKDTFIGLCAEILGEKRVKNASSIDCVKRLARTIGWNGEKTPKNRKFLSDLTDTLTEWNDYPCKDICLEYEIFKDYLNYYKLDSGVMFVCVREPSEIEKLVKQFDALTIILRRDEAEEKRASNHADEEVFDYIYDYQIDNNGDIESLKESAELLLEILNLKKE